MWNEHGKASLDTLGTVIHSECVGLHNENDVWQILMHVERKQVLNGMHANHHPVNPSLGVSSAHFVTVGIFVA